MKKWIVFIIILIIAVIGFISIKTEKDTPSADGKPVVKIGVILPLSGNTAFMGESTQHGMLLAAGHLNSDKKFDYKFIFEDNLGESKRTSVLANKLIRMDKVDAILSILDHNANIIAPLASAKKVIHVGESWFPLYTKHKYNFNMAADLAKEARILAEYIKENNASKVALLTMNASGTLGGATLLRDEFKVQNIDVCADVTFNPGERDFKTIISKIERCSPDWYIVMSFAPEVNIIKKQINENVPREVFVSGMDLGGITDQFPLFEGSVFPNLSELPTHLKEEYIQNYGSTSEAFFTVGYEMLTFLTNAFEEVGRATNEKPSPDEVESYLAHLLATSGVAGIITQKNRHFALPVELKTIKNGKMEVYFKYPNDR